MLFRLNILLFAINLLNININISFSLSTIKEDEKYVYLEYSSIKSFNCEINEEKYFLESNKIIIEKSLIKRSDVSIVLHRNSYNEIYKYKLSYLGDYKTINIDRTNYYIGYHLQGLDNKSNAINNLSKKVCFNSIENDVVEFEDPFSFDFSFLPILKTNEIEVNAEIYFYLEDNLFVDYLYNFFYYKIELSKVYKNEWIYLNLPEFTFPKNYKEENIFVSIYIHIKDVKFYKSFEIDFNNTINRNSSYLYFIELEEGVLLEKNVLHS